MSAYHNIAHVPPPVAVWLEVFWWGENRWITARYDGEHWRDELGRIVRGPVIYWREIQ
jgi:hypothetical protein